jgi:flagellar biosynthesis/type III secretory pathway protein FliH
MSQGKIIRFPLQAIGANTEPPKQDEIVDVKKIDNLQETQTDSAPEEEKVHSLKESELDAIKSKSFQDGVDKGKTEQLQHSQDQVDQISDALETIAKKLDNLEKTRENYIRQLSKEASVLSIEAAKKLMGEVSNVQEHRLLKFFEEVFNKVKSESSIIIKISSTAGQLIEEKLKEKINSLDIGQKVKIVTSPEFSEGQCEVDWELGKASLNPTELLENFQSFTHEKETKIIQDSNQSLKNSDKSDDIIANT